MRIGISTNTIDRCLGLAHVDGLGVYTQNLITELQKLEQQVIPILYPPGFKYKVKPELAGSLVFSQSYPLSTLAAILVPFWNDLNKNLEKSISIYHATDYRIPKFKNIPIIATLHDAIMFKQPGLSNPKLRRIKNWAMRASAKWANRYIAVSKAIVPELVEYWGIDENKIEVIHNGIANSWLEIISEAEKKLVLNKYNLSPDFLLFVGTLQPRKNIDRIIKAFSQLPEEMQKEHKLVLVGKNGWNTAELREQIQQLQLRGIGVWLEYVPFSDLRALYQSAKAFLFPSLHEGFGLPILEAFASKVPVITSNITSMPEIAGEAAYLVDPYDIEQLRYAIYTLLSEPNLCCDYIKKGTERVKQFSWQCCAEKTLAVYQKLLV